MLIFGYWIWQLWTRLLYVFIQQGVGSTIMWYWSQIFVIPLFCTGLSTQQHGSAHNQPKAQSHSEQFLAQNAQLRKLFDQLQKITAGVQQLLDEIFQFFQQQQQVQEQFQSCFAELLKRMPVQQHQVQPGSWGRCWLGAYDPIMNDFHVRLVSELVRFIMWGWYLRPSKRNSFSWIFTKQAKINALWGQIVGVAAIRTIICGCSSSWVSFFLEF